MWYRRLLPFVVLACPAGAQVPATFLSSQDLDAIVTRARADPRAATTLVTLPAIAAGRHRGNIDYRRVVSPPSVHDDDAEFFTVLRGQGELTTGGALTSPVRTGANVSGSGVTGGTARHVAPGDSFVVPAGEPHWFSKVEGELVVLSIHVPK